MKDIDDWDKRFIILAPRREREIERASDVCERECPRRVCVYVRACACVRECVRA
jgi:hypothetical protein